MAAKAGGEGGNKVGKLSQSGHLIALLISGDGRTE